MRRERGRDMVYCAGEVLGCSFSEKSKNQKKDVWSWWKATLVFILCGAQLMRVRCSEYLVPYCASSVPVGEGARSSSHSMSSIPPETASDPDHLQIIGVWCC